MSDLRRKFIYRSAVALVEMKFLWDSFSVLLWHRVTYFHWAGQESKIVYAITPENTT